MTTELINQITSENPRLARMMDMVGQRAPEFRSELEMRLTAVALDPVARDMAEETMDAYWADLDRRRDLLYDARFASSAREVIIGSGYHAAVYAAIRVLSGFPRPLVLERSGRVGGTFAMTRKPTFHLNSRNRAGDIGLAGDRRAALNALPGAPLQAANLNMAEYQSNVDMAFVIRTTLAEYADVVTDVNVEGVEYDGDRPITIRTSEGAIFAKRIIDARGLGNPNAKSNPNSNLYNFGDFMRRMEQPWPLRGMKRVAVLGGGDSAKCAVEALIGVGPQTAMSVTGLDTVERIDWYAEFLPRTCEAWRREIRGRYQGIGASLRPDRFGERRITVMNERALPIALPGSCLINGRTYDMVVSATGFREQQITGLEDFRLTNYRAERQIVSRKVTGEEVYRVGPHASIPFSDAERESGVADIGNNLVAMFRLGGKTAALAATLPQAV